MSGRGPCREGSKKPRPGDILLTSDLDEIPRAWVVSALKRCKGYVGKEIRLDLKFFYYSYLTRARDNWAMIMGTVFPESGEPTLPLTLRNNKATQDVFFKDAGWHCSYCFTDLAHFRNKISSFSHSEFDVPRFHAQETIVRAIQTGKSLFGHVAPDYFYQLKSNQKIDAPPYVLSNPKRFAFMLDRSGPDAELSDFVHGGA